MAPNKNLCDSVANPPPDALLSKRLLMSSLEGPSVDGEDIDVVVEEGFSLEPAHT